MTSSVPLLIYERTRDISDASSLGIVPQITAEMGGGRETEGSLP